MLTPAGTTLGERTPLRRAWAVAAAVAPTARVAHVGPAALTVTFAAIPTAITVLSGTIPVTTTFLVACLLSGAALGWAAEDPAADVLAAMPVSPVARATLRVLCVAAVSALGVAASALGATAGPGVPPAGWDRAPEAVAAAMVALAVGLVAARRDERAVGPIAVAAGVLGTVVIAALATRWPGQLPTFAATPAHDRWWVAVAVAAAVAGRAGRDPNCR